MNIHTLTAQHLTRGPFYARGDTVFKPGQPRLSVAAFHHQGHSNIDREQVYNAAFWTHAANNYMQALAEIRRLNDEIEAYIAADDRCDLPQCTPAAMFARFEEVEVFDASS